MSETQLVQKKGDRKPAAPAKAQPAGPSAHRAAPRPTWAANAAAAPFALAGPVQAKIAVGQPGDAFEREADQVADRVTGGSRAPVRLSPVGPGTLAPLAQRTPAEDRDGAVQREALPGEEREEAPVQAMLAVQRAASPAPPADDEEPEAAVQTRRHPGPIGGASRLGARLQSPGAGEPLPRQVRARVEPVLGADLSGVRVHSDAQARSAAGSLHARAFTHGSGIWLGNGESAGDVRLMAHEAAHVVQQGAAGARQPAAGAAGEAVQGLIPDWILEDLDEYARHIPGWTLFTVIIGYNPLLGVDVERTPTNLLGGFMGLVPFGTAIFDKLVELGVIRDAFAWVEAELSRLDLSLGRLERTIEAAWDDVSITSGFDYNMGVLERHFGGLYNDVVRFAGSLVSHVMQMVKDAVVGVAEGLLAENRAWALIKKVLRHDPLRDVPVQATPVEILEDFLLLIGKEQHLAQMRERGTVEETANWIAGQIEVFMGLLGELRGLLGRAWDAIQPANLPDLMTNLRALATEAGGFLQRVWDFASTVAVKVLELIKNALLGWLAGFADEVPGFHLVTVILGRNPFTGERVPRTAVNVIRGFITLLPGGAGIYARLAETGTIARAAERIDAALQALGISWEFITGIFRGIWDGLSIDDLVDPVGAFTRIMEQFAEPVGRVFRFVGVVLREMITIILEMMSFPSDLIASIISNAMQAIEDVKRDPVGFLLNMLAAVKKGFGSFFDNILTHLTGGLADWLFRGLRQAGLEPPADLSLGSVLDFVLQVLGISMERIWEKLADRVGRPVVDRVRGAVDRLTGIWTFVKDVQERGVGAVWEHIQSQISGLWDMVLEQAQSWIMERVVNRAIQWLASLLDITGIMPVVNSFVAFFNAIQSAIEYMRDILVIVNDYVTTLAAVARGEIDPGAQKMERGLANAIPVAIGFLANQFGLGNIGEKIGEIVGGIRGLVDQALDWLLDRAVSMGQAVLASLGLGGARDGVAPGEERGDLGQTIRFTADGEDHRIWIVRRDRRAVVMMASDPDEATRHLAQFSQQAAALPGNAAAEVNPELQQAREAVAATEQAATREVAAGGAPGAAPAAPAAPPAGGAGGANLVTLEQTVATQVTEALEKIASKRFAKFRSESPHKSQELNEENRRFAPATDRGSIYARSSPRAWERPDYIAFMSTQPAPLKVSSTRTATNDLIKAVADRQASSLNAPGSGRYAIVEPEHTPVVVDITEQAASLDLVEVVRGAGGILPFMQQMGVNGQVTAAGRTLTLRGAGPLSLDRLWESSANRAYLASQFRAPNRHEWLPSDMVYAVIDAIASAPSPQRAVVAEELIKLHNTLRTDTAWVIYKWSKASQTERIGDIQYNIIQGHPGALYRRPDQTGPATVGDPTFHNQLRAAFGPDKTIAQIAAGLQAVFADWVWNGREPLPQPLHPLEIHRIHGRIADVANLGALQGSQQREYGVANATFERFK